MGSTCKLQTGPFKSACPRNVRNRKGLEVVNIIRKELVRMSFRFKEWRAAQRWRILRRYRP